MTTRDKSAPHDASDNTVFLRGRLADAIEEKDLPSGDVLTLFRLTVARAERSRARVDSIECATTRKIVRRTILRAAAGDVVEVTGSLQRRFWRSPTGPASRYTVDVTAAKIRTAKTAPGRPADASPARKPASA